MKERIGDVDMTVDIESAALGIVVGSGCQVAPSPEPWLDAMNDIVTRAASRSEGEVTAHTRPVRDLLRHGRYKPTGRGKPASEYLLRSAREGRFPRINNLVDINNGLSLDTLLPMSLIDLGRAGTRAFMIRRGRPEEAYVFNTTGQTIGLEDLLLVARLPEDAPCANPVKDAMITKVQEDATEVMAVIYAPVLRADMVTSVTERFARALTDYGGAHTVATGVLTTP